MRAPRVRVRGRARENDKDTVQVDPHDKTRVNG